MLQNMHASSLEGSLRQEAAQEEEEAG